MIKGIDIARYQGNPDFRRVKAAGIQYAMLKATEGVNYIDPCFKANAAAAISAGLPIGVYHFLRAGSVADQVRDCLAAIKPYRITWPVAVDVEDAPGTTELSKLGRDKLTDMAIDFCLKIKAAGYPPMIYSNYNWLYVAKYLDVARIKAAGIPIWMAWYSKATPDNTDRSALCDMWQYASDGKADGITSDGLDMNVSYRDFGVVPYTCDTSGAVEIAKGSCYTAKTTGEIELVAGTPGRVQIIRCIQQGYILWHIVPIGEPGQDVGIYPQGRSEKIFTAKIK
ncbi:GH25 family lysozyme [Caproiciproducens sp. CPB-2]|uniref:GH25 family lysozyme n=1 Tax=Caproiciproducens sp. CPB-2 TaxID=3030017 RepID=UPI0023DB68DC|nr:GH25 family lysozyme [Caproiciproducens sp. CPB-2]MDF1495227.1 GH25 family lysozyme [Caproiciproducens sp. CPB-2]